LLDFLREERKTAKISAREVFAMEQQWIRDRVALLGAGVLRSVRSHLPEATMSAVTDRRSYRIVHLTSAHAEWDVRIFQKECRSLARAGYEVISLGNYACNDMIDGVRIRGLGWSTSRIQRMTVKLFGICREAFLAAGDLYHLHDPELLIVGLLLRAAGKRVVYDIHEDLPRTVLFKDYVPKPVRKPLKWIVELVENAAARRMSGLIAATPAIASRFYCMNSNAVVVNNYPILDEFTPLTDLEWESRDPTVTFIGGIAEERGIHEMLAAMDLLPRTLSAKLALGGWFLEEALRADLVATPQWEHVNWHGLLDRIGIASLLNRVQAGLVVLHPNQPYVDSQPTKLFEYMAAGIPVIASDFPLWRSIIQEAGCGILVDPLDTRALASAIERLMTNPSEAEAMGQRGRKAVEERFNWANEERTLLSFYLSLLPGSGLLANPSMQVLAGDPEIT
jgi:glycosyltransferase involved in cell wall biosynthesis